MLDHRGQPFVQLIDIALQAVDTTQLILNADDHHFWQPLFLGFGQCVLNELEQCPVPLRQHDSEGKVTYYYM